jgi:hypothetical protein
MDPVSFAASIAGLATLAGTVVSKGYQYLRAVKTCEEEVRKLIVETNVFCGIVGRLARFADDEEEEDELSSTGFYSGSLNLNRANTSQRRQRYRIISPLAITPWMRFFLSLNASKERLRVRRRPPTVLSSVPAKYLPLRLQSRPKEQTSSADSPSAI